MIIWSVDGVRKTTRKDARECEFALLEYKINMNLMVDGNVRRENYVANKYAMNEYTAEPRKSRTGQLNRTRTRESNETRVSTPGVQRDTTPSRSRKPQQKQQQQQHSVGCMILMTTRSLTPSHTHTHTHFSTFPFPPRSGVCDTLLSLISNM